MKTTLKLIFLSLSIAVILFSTAEGRGGRGGGGGGRRGGGGYRSHSSGSVWSLFGGKSKTKSSGSSSSSDSGYHGSSGYHGYNGPSIIPSNTYNSDFGYHGSSGLSNIPSKSQSSRGWVNGFFHGTPYHYSYRPIYISGGSHSSNTDTQHFSNNVEEKSHYNDASYNHAIDQNNLDKDVGTTLDKQGNATDADNRNYALGYAIGKSLNSDFFSIFNMVHDIAKYPEKIKNKEFQPPADTITITTTPTTATTSDAPAVPNDWNNFINTDINTDINSEALETSLNAVNSQIQQILKLFPTDTISEGTVVPPVDTIPITTTPTTATTSEAPVVPNNWNGLLNTKYNKNSETMEETFDAINSNIHEILKSIPPAIFTERTVPQTHTSDLEYYQNFPFFVDSYPKQKQEPIPGLISA